MLADRQRRPAAYGPDSGYQPLVAHGSRAAHVVAFWRPGGVVTVVPRLSRAVADGGWGDTTIALPPGSWVDVLTGRAATTSAEGQMPVPLSELLGPFPVAVLRPA